MEVFQVWSILWDQGDSNFRLARKKFPEKNTLAYLSAASVTKKKKLFSDDFRSGNTSVVFRRRCDKTVDEIEATVEQKDVVVKDNRQPGETRRGSIFCLGYDQGTLKGEVSLFANKSKNCQLSYSWFQTSQTGGQQYSDTFPFSLPWYDISVTGHFVSCPPVILPSSSWSFHQMIILSSGNIINSSMWSFHQIIIFVNLSFFQVVILSDGHFVRWSFCQVGKSSMVNIAKCLFCWVVISLIDQFCQLLILYSGHFCPPVNLSGSHFVNWSICQVVILSIGHYVR
jgi:hypothetical protein